MPTLKILVIALSGIGDALMFTPSLVKLKEKIPNAEIDTLVMYGGAKDIFQRMEEVNKVLYFPFLNKGALSSLKFILSLRKKYSATINVYPSNRREYNLISFILGAKSRAAVKYLRHDLLNLGFLNNVRIPENDDLHNVEENIRLCEKLAGEKINGIPRLILNLSKDDLEFAENFNRSNNIQPDDIVFGFHPGCSTLKNHEKRRWAPGKFAELGKSLISKYNSRLLIFGGPEESELKEEVAGLISDQSKTIIVNTENLAQTAAVMNRCNVFITNDSSLMHVASAMGLNVAAIIGPTNPNYIHPWQTDHEIISLSLDCAPCFYYSPKPLKCIRKDVAFKCVEELNEKAVAGAVERLLQKEKSGL